MRISEEALLATADAILTGLGEEEGNARIASESLFAQICAA